MSEKKLQVCSYCIMDTSDPDISFNDQGECNHCTNARESMDQRWKPNEEGEKTIKFLVEKMKKDGKGKDYDCILGLSGGVDSSYLAIKAKEYGLRTLLVHVDAGWNSELAVKNIECIVDATGFDLFTHVIDWPSMRELHRSFFKAEVPNQDIPQDHAFAGAVYHFANKHKVDWIVHGDNFATECILPASWGYTAMDKVHIKAIHSKFGTKKIDGFPFISVFKQYCYYPLIKNMRPAYFLNYMPYSKEKAIKKLEANGWRYYGGKHFESRFTKFFQSYYLVNKFGFDKRKAHLSSLIVSGQLTREAALKELEKPAWDVESLEGDIEFVAKKLGFKIEEFKTLCDSPPKQHKDYPRGRWRMKLIAGGATRLCKILGRGRI